MLARDSKIAMKVFYIVPIKATDPIEDDKQAMKLPAKFMSRSAAETVCEMMNKNRNIGHSGYMVEERETAG